MGNHLRKRPGRMAPVTAAVLTAAVLLAACGGGGEAAAPTTTSTTVPQIELDKRKAEQAVLAAADLPGYTDDADEDEGDDLAGASECVGASPLLVVLGEAGDPRGASSPTRSSGVHSVSSSVSFAETEDEATAALAVVEDEATATCLGNALVADMRATPGFTNPRLTTSRLPAVSAGDQQAGFRMVLRATVAGQVLTFNFDQTFVRAGRGVAVVFTFSEGATFPNAERSRLVTAVASRMAA
jgi:hypothetical protein